MKNVLIIGAGRGQVPIIKICQKYGYDVHVVSPYGNYPGLRIANHVCDTDIREYDRVISYAKENSISAVMTDQLDAGVYTAALVAERLGIKGISTEVANKFTNKYVMRKAAQEAGINVPKHWKIGSISEIDNIHKELVFPLMMKPVDSAASRGIYKVASIDDIKTHFDYTISFSKTQEIILEEYIDGKEYVVEAYTHDHKTHNLVVGHRDYFDIPETFIPNATVFRDAVSADSDIESRLKEINQRLVSSFNLSFVITHGEYIYNEKQDKIFLVEIAARGGGVFISSDLIPLGCGVDANDLLVRDALGLPVDDHIAISQGASAYFCYLTPEGEVCKLDNTDKVKDIQGVDKCYFDNIELGMKTASIRDKSSRKGPIIVFGKTKDECYKIIDKVRNALDIKINTSKGVEDIIWG